VNQWDILTGEAERDRRNVTILMESVAELYGLMGLDELNRRAVDRAIKVTGAERGILLLDGDQGRLAARVARSRKGQDMPLELRYSRSVVDKVWTTGKPHQTVDAEDPSAHSLGQSIVELRLLSIMAVPLPSRGRNLGVLYVDSTVQAKEFTQADFSVMKALGGLIALAVENARLAAAQAEKQRLERELAVARDIQQRLLPKDLPIPAGLDLAAQGHPAEETSGDYYDVIPLADGRLALVVGDVSGHGLGPALFMASTRAVLHSLLHTPASPEQIMGTLNAFLKRDMPVGSFMSLFLGVLDPRTRTLAYVSAGHNPPLLVRRGGAIEELRRTGPLLGIMDGPVYRLSPPVALASGDVLVLYTDGIYEAQSAKEEMYGEERFIASLVRYAARGTKAQDVLEGTLGDLFAFTVGRPLDDDVTCLVLRAT
jgi:sigma-B regulation protein RsbU (phosphoserine phosphatase)